MKSNAREVALLTLSACEKQGAWSDLALKKNIRDGELDSRDAVRYTVNAPGRVTGLYVADRLMPLSHPESVTVVNLSTQGCLVRYQNLMLKAGSQFCLYFDAGNIPPMKAQVVRVKTINASTKECGCRLLGSEG